MLVDAQSKEFNYQTQGKTDKFTRYRGADGVQMSNLVRRAAFALRFGSIDPLISGQVTSKTRVLMERDIRSRVEKLAPFLRFDADPYPVVLGNKTVWMMDGYTATNMYPYSQANTGEGGLAADINYVRNSVKVTVDAYQGTVKFYVFDQKDPIIRAWQQGVPRPVHAQVADARRTREAPALPRRPVQGAVEHVRPLPRHRAAPVLRRQRQVAGVVRPGFVGGATPRCSSTPVARRAPTTSRRQRRRAAGASTRTTSTSSFPATTRQSFVALEPFVPVSSGNSINRLVSFLTAKSDPGSYGKLQSFVMPTSTNVDGPVAGRQPDQQPTADLPGVHVPEPTGLHRDQGQPAADPGRQLDHLRATDLRAQLRARAASRSSSSSRCTPRARTRCARRRSKRRSTGSS